VTRHINQVWQPDLVYVLGDVADLVSFSFILDFMTRQYTRYRSRSRQTISLRTSFCPSGIALCHEYRLRGNLQPNSPSVPSETNMNTCISTRLIQETNAIAFDAPKLQKNLWNIEITLTLITPSMTRVRGRAQVHTCKCTIITNMYAQSLV
jgi:hypothetical protein